MDIPITYTLAILYLKYEVKTVFNVSASKFIQEFCKPFKEMALTNFMHDITFGHGQISMLVSNEGVASFYAKNKIPMLCTDDSGRTLEEGIYINKILEDQYKDCSILMPLMVQVSEQFGQNSGKNSLHILRKENDCQHLYSLFFDLPEKEFLHWIINNGNFLSDFIENYNTLAHDLILEGKSPENRIVLPNFNPTLLSNEADPSSTPLTLLHKTLHMPVHLSSQQSRCLRLLIQGKSAKEISIEMKLSHRTIEHYLEKIKKILGCATSKELITSYFDQIVF